ncbi:MAG: DNA helicase [Actinomycetes bacterium]
MSHEQDLVEEQAFLDTAYAALEVMRSEANAMMADVLDLGKGGTFQSRTERDIVVRTSLARLNQLDIGDQALCFGRIDTHPNDEVPDGEVFRIGRLAVSNDELEPLVVDWRAPIAEPFYRATALDPQGLSRRRHLAIRDRNVVGLEDEFFADAEGNLVLPKSGSAEVHEGLIEGGMALGGAGALLTALGQARSGQMGDIVATIQGEQDEIIRAPLSGTLMVQGGPGTGKTAVALHRAAYLLYTHRFPLERQGVLVLGPNPLFLRYIEQVLPSLGETGVSLSTIGGLVREIKISGQDAPEVAALKGDLRMTQVLARAVATRERALRQDLDIPYGIGVLKLTVADSEQVIRRARRRQGTHNQIRRFVETELSRILAERYRRLAGWSDDDDGEALDETMRLIRATPEFLEMLSRVWPRLSPHELLHDLFGALPLIRIAARGILSEADADALARPRSGDLDEVPWTVADAALVDELRELLGPRHPARKRRMQARDENSWPEGLEAIVTPEEIAALDDPARRYGHIVVDEVQDLSPMQLRMVARRSLAGSMTVVGDIAQATGPCPPKDWAEIAAQLTPKRDPLLVELSVSFRTPAEVIEVARHVLAVGAPDIEPPKPVRRSGLEPVIRQVEPAGLSAALGELTKAAQAAMGEGRVAVIVPPEIMGEMSRALEAAGLSVVNPALAPAVGLHAPLVILAADQANGLEFDAVVVVEPSLIASLHGKAINPRGVRTLYVSITRPTRFLAVLGCDTALLLPTNV